jgi:hypothetical protein
MDTLILDPPSELPRQARDDPVVELSRVCVSANWTPARRIVFLGTGHDDAGGQVRLELADDILSRLLLFHLDDTGPAVASIIGFRVTSGWKSSIARCSTSWAQAIGAPVVAQAPTPT